MCDVYTRTLSCALIAFALSACSGGADLTGSELAAEQPQLQYGGGGGTKTINPNLGAVATNLPAADQPACAILVPEHPLTAQGLATPYVLLPPCHEATSGAFVQAVILDPIAGKLSVYNPLVIDEGTFPLLPPTFPMLSPNAIVGIWFGFNGTTLIPVAENMSTLTFADCVSGLGNSFFGQVSACNAVNFFAAAESAIAHGKIKPPPLGTAKDGQPCPTTRDFSVVDQDPSDNVTTSYLVAANGRLAQNTPVNQFILKLFHVPTAVIGNGSDNALLSMHIDPAMGCTPWMATDMTDPSGLTKMPAQALDELHAQAWHNPNNVPLNTIALVEAGDEMALVNGNPNLTKMNLYRANVNQPPNILAGNANWCTSLATLGAARLSADQAMTQAAATLDPAVGTNLFTFLVARMQGTMADGGIGLNCAQYGVTFPFQVTTDANGVVTAATYTPFGTPPVNNQ